MKQISLKKSPLCGENRLQALLGGKPEKSLVRRKLAKYRGKGYRGSRYRHYNPYRASRYSPYRLRSSRYRSPYLKRGYEVRPEQPYESYKRNEDNKPEVEQRVLSREEFFKRYPPSFPEHWSEEFRKEVMDRMYDRYVDFMGWKALSEGMKEPQAEKKEEKRPENEEDVKEEAVEFKQDPQDRLLEIIREKGIESPEGRAAYEELLRIQHAEINRLEDEYGKEVEKSENEANLLGKNEQPFEEPESNEELSQEEAEEILNQLEDELFNDNIDQTEAKAEELAEKALEMDDSEIESLVEQALEETDIESVEIDSSLEGEEDAEYEDEAETEV
ncbi:MAG: hypothetical protein QXP56_04685 [Archaeoglobaceae archaeon]